MNQVRTPRVYVVQEPRNKPNLSSYDISPCLEFGEVHHIFQSPEQPGLVPFIATKRVREVLRDFCPDTDHILWAGGDPYGLALVSAMLITLHGRYKFLRWERRRDRPKGMYVVVHMNMDTGENIG